MTLNIHDKPTYDLTGIEFVSFDAENNLVYLKSKQVFHFDKCTALILPRSRTLRPECQESQYVENIIGAVIDANYTGHLF
jgi:hypothetical protein